MLRRGEARESLSIPEKVDHGCYYPTNQLHGLVMRNLYNFIKHKANTVITLNVKEGHSIFPVEVALPLAVEKAVEISDRVPRPELFRNLTGKAHNEFTLI
jgi:hypothetical protein